MARYIVGITGASGVVHGIRLVEQLLKLGHYVHVIITHSGIRVIKDELELDLEGGFERRYEILSAQLGAEPNFVLHDVEDMGSAIASGSFKSDAMLIVPCSMGTLASIAWGYSSNLLERAADVTLKEGRKLVLSPRETPLNAIHLENMLKLSRMGVAIVPPMPAFYIRPHGLEDMVDFIIGRLLDQLGIEHSLYPRWQGSKTGLKPDY